MKQASSQKKRIVTIGGGTGSYVVLNSLRDHPVELAAIVSMADDGGSTGVLRDQYGTLPPGDVRRALVALSESNKAMRKLFQYRFRDGSLRGHSFGNLFLTALEKTTGSFARAVHETSRVLNVKGKVIPATYDNVRLHARLKNGEIIRGESHIDIPKNLRRAAIEKVWLAPEAGINKCARRAIQKADLVIIGPGDLYTSLIPNLLVRGMPQALKKSKAVKAYLCNLMTKKGETDGFTGEDFVREIEKYLGTGVLDYVIFNSKKPHARLLRKYKKEGAIIVRPPRTNTKKRRPAYIAANLIEVAGIVRHGPPKKLSKVLLSLIP